MQMLHGGISNAAVAQGSERRMDFLIVERQQGRPQRDADA